MTDFAVDLRGAPRELFSSIVGYRGVQRFREVIMIGPAGSGKTRGVCQVLAILAQAVPGLRILLCRQTRKSMTQSTLKEWEECFAPGSPVLEGPARNNRSVYDGFGNGSEVAVCGLDDPVNLFSSKWDIVFVDECRQISLDSWELFRRGMRGFNPALKEQLLIGVSNPDVPTHWIRGRIRAGLCQFLDSVHKDNPAYFDAAKNDWTEAGRSYMQILDGLTGVRKRRLKLGEWCAAEGMVWPEWNDEMHIVTAKVFKDGSQVYVHPDWSPVPIEIEWTFASFDWGYDAPSSLSVYGIDTERRLWRLAQLYTGHKLMDWWVERVWELYKEFDLYGMVCDPSKPEAIEAFNRRIAVDRGLDMPAFCTKADNKKRGDFGGLEEVRTVLSLRSDGRPGCYFVRDARRQIHGDDTEDLLRKAQPICTEEEIPGYIYLQYDDGRVAHDETDPKCPDHGCDDFRYACKYANVRDLREPKRSVLCRPGTVGCRDTWPGQRTFEEWLIEQNEPAEIA